MFYAPRAYSAVALLEANFEAIQHDFERLSAARFMPWPERELYGDGWTVFGFYAFGRRLSDNCRMCPDTASILDRIGCTMQAGFSRLAPHTHIRPHRGRAKPELRCHLALEVPEGDVALRVGTDVRRWERGRCLLFDDTAEHEAWNRTERDRVVLLLDINREPDRNACAS